MDERPTPETDALVAKWDYSPIPKVMEAHARTLERQRDGNARMLTKTLIERNRAFRQMDELLVALKAAKPLLEEIDNDEMERPLRRVRAEQLLAMSEAAIAAVKGGK